MDKPKLNFIIDILMFVCMALLASIGFLMKFSLIPGRDCWVKYGKNVELFLFGLDRHQWGTVHLYLSFALIVLLILHIYLHWRLTVRLYQKLIASPALRKTGLWILIVITVFLIVFPFVVNPKVVESEAGKGHRSLRRVGGTERETPIERPLETTDEPTDETIKENTIESATEHPVDTLQHGSHEKYTVSGRAVEVKGYMTLNEVARIYNVPVSAILNGLGLPESALQVQKLGRLRKLYHFTMTDVEKILCEYHKMHEQEE